MIEDILDELIFKHRYENMRSPVCILISSRTGYDFKKLQAEKNNMCDSTRVIGITPFAYFQGIPIYRTEDIDISEIIIY